MCSPVIATVHLRILSISNQEMFLRPLKDFRIVFVEDEDESTASYFVQARDVRFVSMICLEGGDIVE